MEALDVKYGRDINCLREKDKNVRINALKRLEQELFKEEISSLRHLFAGKMKGPLLEVLKDPADKCKELAVEIIRKMLVGDHIEVDDVYLVLKGIHSRLAVEPCLETCEEVRIAEMGLVSIILEKFVKFIQPCISDVTDILARLGKDKCPAIKNQVSSAVIFIAKNGLRFGSKKILDGIRSNSSHQQFKVRCLSLEAFGALSLHDSGVAEELFIEFKKAQVDRRPEVRLQTYAVVNEILTHMNYADLVKIEGKFVYLLIGGLNDEECAFKVQEWFTSASFRVFQAAQDYGESLQEFQESWLVKRNVRNLVEICLSDIQEWTIQDFYRSRAVNVLKNVVDMAGNDVCPFLDKVLKVLFNAYATSNDLKYSELLEVVVFRLASNIQLVSILNAYENIMVETLSSVEKAAGLKLLSPLVQGVEKTLSNLGLLVDFLFVKDFVADYSLHIALLLPVSSIIATFQLDCKTYMNELFYILLTLENTLKDQTLSTVSLLADHCGFSRVSDLYSLELPFTLPKIITNHYSWDSSSFERRQFRNLITRAGAGVKPFWDSILKVLVENCSKDKDNEVRYDMLAVFESLSTNPDLEGLLYSSSEAVLCSIITSTAAWKVGVSSVQIRISSLVCFNNLVKSKALNIQVLNKNWEKFFAAFSGCLDDDWDNELRLAALQSVLTLASQEHEQLEAKCLEGLLKETLKRLDDSVNAIRVLATKPLEKLIREIGNKGICVEGIDKIIRVLLLHLDDDNELLRTGVFDVLLALGENWKELLLDIAKEKREKQRNGEIVDKLMNMIV
jgi:hypothetical protein